MTTIAKAILRSVLGVLLFPPICAALFLLSVLAAHAEKRSRPLPFHPPETAP